ncbi:MAG: hypothetical protein HY657_11540 [Acidobacteria bacterium]|nr:hypothetical protein [Acidobacteriota bacterium]
MTARYAVTFEFESKPILTVHGHVSASGMPTLVAGRQPWSSVVVVIERVRPSFAIDDDAVVKPVAAVTVTPVGMAQRPDDRGTSRGPLA